MNLLPVMETSEKLGAKEFVKAAKNNGLEEMLTKKNVTLFLPTDTSFTEFSEQMFESVVTFRVEIFLASNCLKNSRI